MKKMVGSVLVALILSTLSNSAIARTTYEKKNSLMSYELRTIAASVESYMKATKANFGEDFLESFQEQFLVNKDPAQEPLNTVRQFLRWHSNWEAKSSDEIGATEITSIPARELHQATYWGWEYDQTGWPELDEISDELHVVKFVAEQMVRQNDHIKMYSAGYVVNTGGWYIAGGLLFWDIQTNEIMTLFVMAGEE